MNASPEQVLLVLVFPPALSDPLVDWLLDQPEVSGFVRHAADGYGGSEHDMSPAERVAGFRANRMIQAHLPADQAEALLARLRREFCGSDIHYWLVPVLGAGHLTACVPGGSSV